MNRLPKCKVIFEWALSGLLEYTVAEKAGISNDQIYGNIQ